MVKDTTVNSNIETLSFHFALIGLCYILAIGISKILGLLPSFLGDSMEGLMFMNGMFVAYIVKFMMKKSHIDFLQEDVLQKQDYGLDCRLPCGMCVYGSWYRCNRKVDCADPH